MDGISSFQKDGQASSWVSLNVFNNTFTNRNQIAPVAKPNFVVFLCMVRAAIGSLDDLCADSKFPRWIYP